jgi:hypothetical protein
LRLGHLAGGFFSTENVHHTNTGHGVYCLIEEKNLSTKPLMADVIELRRAKAASLGPQFVTAPGSELPKNSQPKLFRACGGHCRVDRFSITQTDLCLRIADTLYGSPRVLQPRGLYSLLGPVRGHRWKCLPTLPHGMTVKQSPDQQTTPYSFLFKTRSGCIRNHENETVDRTIINCVEEPSKSSFAS